MRLKAHAHSVELMFRDPVYRPVTLGCDVSLGNILYLKMSKSRTRTKSYLK